ncbi:hypothetical protein V5799_026016 [Amblyomma americanum]|uniref:Secreted protein n=1 Tax=Amblyomma americanum TaxID=6943 RepID=A0AAQ4DJS9_AMBAM
MTRKRAIRVLAVVAVFLNVTNARPPPKERDQHTSCDWKQSGLAQSSGGVLPVYLDSCHSGTVRWSQPRGALRIVLRATDRRAHHRQFQACFRLEARSSGALVYLETAQGDLVPGPGVRAKCVLSRGGSVVAYAVASPGASSWGKMRHQLTMTYTTGQPVASFERLEGWEECRPCTETELRERYCLSDLGKCFSYLNIFLRRQNCARVFPVQLS